VSTLFLLYPEWQGSGRAHVVHQGALTIAREVFPSKTFLTIESPENEDLQRENEVIGLRSIAPRFRAALQRVREAAPDRIVTVGGTCGVEAAPVGYLNERYGGDLAVVWLDAHGDLNTPSSSPSGNFHGMVLRTLLGDGPAEYTDALARPLRPSQIFLAATRDLDPPEQTFVAASGISVTRPEELAVPDTLARRISSAGFTHVYVHLDLDALDPREFGDMLIPTPGGPRLDHVISAVSSLAALDVVGFSIVEYVPRTAESLDVLRDFVARVRRNEKGGSPRRNGPPRHSSEG
jgi:arginase